MLTVSSTCFLILASEDVDRYHRQLAGYNLHKQESYFAGNEGAWLVDVDDDAAAADIRSALGGELDASFGLRITYTTEEERAAFQLLLALPRALENRLGIALRPGEAFVTLTPDEQKDRLVAILADYALPLAQGDQASQGQASQLPSPVPPTAAPSATVSFDERVERLWTELEEEIPSALLGGNLPVDWPTATVADHWPEGITWPAGSDARLLLKWLGDAHSKGEAWLQMTFRQQDRYERKGGGLLVEAPAVPRGLRPRRGVEVGCGSNSCTKCYEPDLSVASSSIPGRV